MNKRQRIILITLGSILAVLSIIWLTNKKKVADHPSVATILSTFQQEANLVATELTIRKIAYYDSSMHEHISFSDPSTWKFGERKCIAPVEIKIKYGYDLRKLTLDNVKVNDSLRVIEVTLPEPKIIDSKFNNEIDYSKVVCIATGLRDEVGGSPDVSGQLSQAGQGTDPLLYPTGKRQPRFGIRLHRRPAPVRGDGQ